MSVNLDTLKTEIATQLASDGYVVFHGRSRLLDAIAIVYWDSERVPDFREYLKVARQLDAKVIVYHQREFMAEQLDEALARLEETQIPRDQRRAMERRLRDLRAYEGFTCVLELSFEHHGRVYMFELETEWHAELNDILDEIEDSIEEGGDEEPLGGFYSRN